jgi:hypothetical protein
MNQVGKRHLAGMKARKRCISDRNDEECEFVAPYLSLLPRDARLRDHDLRAAFDRPQ